VTSPPSPVPERTVRAVLAHAAARPPLLGGGRLICVDGWTGTGKTTLAAALVHAARREGLDVALVHTDDVLLGWGGLPSLGPRLRNGLVGPLASGHTARIRRWDWHADRPGDLLVVAPVDLLVLEGVGASSRRVASRCATAVRTTGPREACLERSVARDGEHVRAHLLAWQEAEDRLRQELGVAPDLQVDDLGRLLPPEEAATVATSTARRAGP
jgi:hypothetical protein